MPFHHYSAVHISSSSCSSVSRFLSKRNSLLPPRLRVLSMCPVALLLMMPPRRHGRRTRLTALPSGEAHVLYVVRGRIRAEALMPGRKPRWLMHVPLRRRPSVDARVLKGEELLHLASGSYGLQDWKCYRDAKRHSRV